MNAERRWQTFKAQLIAAAEQHPELLPSLDKLMFHYEVAFKCGYESGRADACNEVAEMFPHPSPTAGSVQVRVAE